MFEWLKGKGKGGRGRPDFSAVDSKEKAEGPFQERPVAKAPASAA